MRLLARIKTASLKKASQIYHRLKKRHNIQWKTVFKKVIKNRKKGR